MKNLLKGFNRRFDLAPERISKDILIAVLHTNEQRKIMDRTSNKHEMPLSISICA